MQKHSFANGLSPWGAVAILLVFYISANGIFSFAYGLGPDGFLAQLIGFGMAAPLLLIFARLAQILPGMNLYDMLDYSFGRWIAWVLSLFYTLYFISLTAVAQVQYAAFIRLVSLVNTPLLVILLAFFALSAYLAKSGVQTLGKWSLLIGAVSVIFTLGLTLLAIPNMRFEHLLPIGTNTPASMLRSGGKFAVFPLGEAVVILALFGRLEKAEKPYKLFFFGALFALLFFLLTFFRDTAILGTALLDMLHYPSFTAAGVVQIGAIGGRVDIFFAGLMLLTGLTKAAICLIAANRGVRRMFSLSDEHALLLPLGFFSVGLSAVLFPNLAELFAHPSVHVYYAPLFQGVIPGLLWLLAEWKVRRKPPLTAYAGQTAGSCD